MLHVQETPFNLYSRINKLNYIWTTYQSHKNNALFFTQTRKPTRMHST